MAIDTTDRWTALLIVAREANHICSAKIVLWRLGWRWSSRPIRCLTVKRDTA